MYYYYEYKLADGGTIRLKANCKENVMKVYLRQFKNLVHDAGYWDAHKFVPYLISMGVHAKNIEWTELVGY